MTRPGILASVRRAAGGGGGDDPPVAGYSLWLDGADESTITDSVGAVSQWDDKSGNDLHVSQATGANQPATGATTLNSLNVLSFSSGDRLTRTGTSLGASALSIFSVFRKTGANNSFEAMPLTLTASNQGRPFDGWDGNRFVETANKSGYVNIKSQTAWCQLTQIAVSGSPNTIAERKDAADVASNTHAATWSTTSQVLTVASRADGATLLTGDIAEILVYETALSDTDRDAVEAYLATKWGL